MFVNIWALKLKSYLPVRTRWYVVQYGLVTMPSSHLNHQVRLWCGVQNGQKLIWLYKENIFVNNDI